MKSTLIIIISTAFWSPWQWKGCSSTCGEGIETFIRSCMGEGECQGDAIRQEKCEDLPDCGKFFFVFF